jgi:hypothetical protein
MKTLIILLVSSLFFSNVSNDKENDSIQKNIKVKIEKSNIIANDKGLDIRMPIIIVKRD